MGKVTKHSNLLIILICLFFSTQSLAAVKFSSGQKDKSSKFDWITTSLASRAYSDVQVRRLMNMFSAQKIDADDLYKGLKKMEKAQK